MLHFLFQWHDSMGPQRKRQADLETENILYFLLYAACFGRLLIQCPGNRSAFFASNLSVSPCLGSSLFTNEEMEKQVGLCHRLGQNAVPTIFFKFQTLIFFLNMILMNIIIMHTCTVMFSHSQFQ